MLCWDSDIIHSAIALKFHGVSFRFYFVFGKVVIFDESRRNWTGKGQMFIFFLSHSVARKLKKKEKQKKRKAYEPKLTSEGKRNNLALLPSFYYSETTCDLMGSPLLPDRNDGLLHV